jgi:hypothetical protein
MRSRPLGGGEGGKGLQGLGILVMEGGKGNSSHPLRGWLGDFFEKC